MGEKLTREQVEEIVREAREKGERPDLSGVDLSEAKLSRMDLSGAKLFMADLRRVDLFMANLSRTDLFLANLSEANLSGIHLIGADLRRADLRRADLNWAKLSGADLSGADLSGAKLSEANLSEANLSEANLSEANLSEANLSEANLSEANLIEADLSGADLSRADLSRADLSRADLSQANLTETDLNKAYIYQTVFADVELSTVKGLDTVEHRGPSYIDIHTLYRSQGNIPAAFLRGAGAPDTFIAHVTSLTGQAIQYYSCFISYASQDDDFARRLHNDLQAAGVRCWFAPEDMKIGDKIRLRIDESIRIHDKLLVILSENSVSSSWVEKEVETAFEEEERRGQTVLFPVRLDQSVMETRQPWAADIRRTRHIGDFRPWKEHDAYQRAFERLLRDLKAEESPTVPERFQAAAQPGRAGRVDSLRRQLARHTANRDKLAEEIAVFAIGERPLHLRNQIDEEEREIARLEAELAELDRAGQPEGDS